MRSALDAPSLLAKHALPARLPPSLSSHEPCPGPLCIAHDPGLRLCDIATTLGMTERSAYCVVAELTVGGYVVQEKEEKDGRRNRYQIQAHLPLRGAINRERKIGEGWTFWSTRTLAHEDEKGLADARAGGSPPSPGCRGYGQRSFVAVGWVMAR